MSDPNADPGLAIYFSLTIDGIDLGTFSTCSGLAVELKVNQRAEGGTGDFVNQMPGRFEYQPITLTRPIGPDSAKIANWIQANAQQVQPKTAELAALDPQGNQVYAWSLQGVLPRRWTGPNFDSSSPQVAVETLELVFQGFL
jgi:phage tail-like protein